MKKNWLINLILLSAIVFNLSQSYKLFDFGKLAKPFDFKKYENRYNKSQWVVPNSKQSVGDDVVYAYAGAKYIYGESPILVNSEHPPLAKNLIGLSAVYLGNEYYYGLFSGIFALIGFFFLSNAILKNRFTSLLVTLTVGLEPLFVVNYFSTLLDLIVLGFLNWYFYFLVRYDKTRRTALIYGSGVALGFAVSVKFFGIAAPIIVSTLVYFVIARDIMGILNYFISLVFSLFILIANYFQFFLHGNGFVDFLKLQKYMFVFHTSGRQSSVGLNWSYPNLLLLGKFFTDKNKLASENHYSVLWPLVSLTSLVAIPKRLTSPLVIWIIIYSLTQLASLTNARYLILILPYLYLTAVDIIKK